MKEKLCFNNLITFFDKVTHLVDEGNVADMRQGWEILAKI